MTGEPAVSALLEAVDARLAATTESTTRLAILVDSSRRVARDLQAVDVFVGLPLTYDLDDAASELAALGIPDPQVDLPSITSDQAREVLRTLLQLLAEHALDEDLPGEVRVVAARAGADAAEACVWLLTQ